VLVPGELFRLVIATCDGHSGVSEGQRWPIGAFMKSHLCVQAQNVPAAA